MVVEKERPTAKALSWGAGIALIVLGVPAASAAGTYVKLDSGFAWAESATVKDRNGFASYDDCLICVPGELDHVENGPLVGIGMGYHVTHSFRFDVTYTYRGWNRLAAEDSRSTHYHSDIKSDALMLSGYYDFPPFRAKLRPYVGAGIGWARSRMSTIHQDWSVAPTGTQQDPGGSTSGFAWQMMLGLTYPMSAAWSADIGYRHFDGGRLQTDPGTSDVRYTGLRAYTYRSGGVQGRLRTDELTVSLRYGL